MTPVGLALFLAFQPFVAAQPPAGPSVAVVILPLLPEGSVSLKQARGVGAQLRASVEAGGYARLLSRTSDDDKQAERCGKEPKCLGDLAALRGADLLLAGSVAPAPDGLRITVLVVSPGSSGPLRRADVTLQGSDRDPRRLDRLGRSALAPEALRGSLRVSGEDGASVEVDGQPVGTLPLPAPLAELAEGDHLVIVRKTGREDARRTIAVVHEETTDLKVVLLSADADLQRDPLPGSSRGVQGRELPLHAVVASSIGAGLLLLGGVSGALSFRDSLDVEKRAAAQQLAFPKDSGLLLRGQIFAWTANALYAAGAIGLAVGGVLWVLPDEGVSR